MGVGGSSCGAGVKALAGVPLGTGGPGAAGTGGQICAPVLLLTFCTLVPIGPRTLGAGGQMGTPILVLMVFTFVRIGPGTLGRGGDLSASKWRPGFSTLGTKGPRRFGTEGAFGATTFVGNESAILRDKMSPRTGGLGVRVDGAFVRRRL